MTEDQAIATAVLQTPQPDRYVDCGESRPLPMYHMDTLMQYGERCAKAALEWARTRQDVVTAETRRCASIARALNCPQVAGAIEGRR